MDAELIDAPEGPPGLSPLRMRPNFEPVVPGHPRATEGMCITAETGPACPSWVCAVERRRFPVGASPTRRPLQPEAAGAAMEVTK
jgi:hypothetical protein